MREAQDILIIMLDRLSDEMGLVGPVRFGAYYSNAAPSITNLTLLRYPKHDREFTESSVSHNKHTDIGPLTLRFYKQWGVQVLSPDTETWAFVRPREKHAVITARFRHTPRDPVAKEAAGGSLQHYLLPAGERRRAPSRREWEVVVGEGVA